MKQALSHRRGPRRHTLLAAVAASGFAFCMVSGQYAQAAPKATDLQVEEGEAQPKILPLIGAFAVGYIVKDLIDKYGNSNVPNDLIDSLPEKPVPSPVAKVLIGAVSKKIGPPPAYLPYDGQSPQSGELKSASTLSTEDAYKVLN